LNEPRANIQRISVKSENTEFHETYHDGVRLRLFLCHNSCFFREFPELVKFTLLSSKAGNDFDGCEGLFSDTAELFDSV